MITANNNFLNFNQAFEQPYFVERAGFGESLRFLVSFGNGGLRLIRPFGPNDNCKMTQTTL